MTNTEVTINTTDLQWQGMVTARINGIDVVLGMFGEVSSAEYYAKKMIKSGKYKGVRAWSCIGEYGEVPKDRLPDPDHLQTVDEGEEGITVKPDPTCRLDKWCE